MRSSWLPAVAAALLLAGGCVQRTLTVESDPPGALVYLNNDEIGRTPAQRDFTHYGVYDVVLRKPGYEPLYAPTLVAAPIWQWFPLDLLFEVLPVRLRHGPVLNYTLTPVEDEVDTAELLRRAEDLRQRLKGPPAR